MTAMDEEYLLYHYNPSLAAAIVSVVLFALSTAAHITQLINKRTWYFIPFVIGGLFETVGYIGRAVGSQESPDWTLGPYIVQSLLILLAPAFFAASIYIILGRIISLTDGETHSVIRVKWITKIFVTGDVLSFAVQSSGGGMLAAAKDPDAFKMGELVIIVGLGIQVFFFAFFIVTAALFHYRIVRVPTRRLETIHVPWQRYLMVLYTTSSLIMVRSIFRVVEYVMGQDGVLLSYEYFLYLFDAVLMFVMMVLFNVWHPSEVLGVTKNDEESEVALESVGERGE